MKKILTFVFALCVFSFSSKAEEKNEKLALTTQKTKTQINFISETEIPKISSNNQLQKSFDEATKVKLACGVTLDVSLPPVSNYDYSGFSRFLEYLDWVFCQAGFMTMFYF
jgi:hypothetical protein